MVPVAHKLCFTLIAIALAIFYAAYYHSWYINDSVYSYSQFVATVTSLFSTKEVAAEPEWVAPGFSITEDRAILIFFGIGILLALGSLGIGVWHRIKVGASKFFVPIVFLSVSVIGCIAYVGFQIGLHTYA